MSQGFAPSPRIQMSSRPEPVMPAKRSVAIAGGGTETVRQDMPVKRRIRARSSGGTTMAELSYGETASQSSPLEDAHAWTRIRLLSGGNGGGGVRDQRQPSQRSTLPYPTAYADVADPATTL